MEDDDDDPLLSGNPAPPQARFTLEQRVDKIERYLIRTREDTAQIPRLARLLRWILNAEEGEEPAKIDQMARDRGRFVTGLQNKATIRASFWKWLWPAFGVAALTVLGSMFSGLITPLLGHHP